MAMQESELQELLKKEATNTTTSSLEQTETHPLQTTELPELIDDLENLEKPSLELESLKKIDNAKSDLSKIKTVLDGIIDTMAADPSLITRAANAWGELPLWQKILGGVVLSGPTLAAGLFAHIAALMVIGGATGVAYTASGIILDDHHFHNVSIASKLKSGVGDLADLLLVTINALEEIVKDLKFEIQKFSDENLRLAVNVSELSSEVKSLTSQVELFMKTQELLRETRNDLERTAVDLKQSVEDQTKLLHANELLLKQVKEDYQKNEKQLSAKVAELQSVRVAMDLEVEKARTVANTLEGTVLSLTGTVVKDKEKRLQFQSNLDQFLKDKEGSFDKVATRICDAEEELEKVKRELEDSNTRYKELLDRQEDQVTRLEQLDRDLAAENIHPNKVHAKGLKQHGIYRTKCEEPSLVTYTPQMVKV